MIRRNLILLVAWLLATLPGHATDYRKLSGHVRGIMLRQEAMAASRQAVRQPQQPQRQLTAFVRINPTQASRLWQQYGCRPYARYGDLAIVGIPVCNVGPMSDDPAVRRIEASPSGHTTMDTTAIIVGANRLHIPPRNLLLQPFTGHGVVVGIMDIGFDLTHPNFYDASATNYRIGAFWDQLSRDTVGSQLPVGRDYVGADVVRAQQHSTDGLMQTHGTHTLGIAAGSGYQSTYRGIAFDSDICIVSNAVTESIALIDSTDLDKYTTAIDALGFKYIFDYADSQGKPCVASLSEGYPPYLDEEDSLYAAFLDSLSGPGHIIVASAGNEGIAKTYAGKPKGVVAAGAFIQAPNSQAFYRMKADGPMALSVYAYSGGSQVPTDTLRFASADIPVDSLKADTLFIKGDTCAVLVGRYPSAFAADTVYNVYLLANKALTSLANIALVMEGKETQAELFGSSSYSLANLPTDQRWNTAVSAHNIHAPGCFPSVICVGATAHRLGFTNYKGVYNDYSAGRTVGCISPYSSTGPAMNNLTKPNVVAPGDNIISSYSSYYIEANPEAGDINSDVEHFDFQGRTYAWNANTGTSMAAPVVAGVIALWLQARPDLTPQEVADVLSRTCRHPETTLTYPNPTYGYGEIDAYRGLLELLGINRIEGVSLHQPARLHITMQDGQLQLQFDETPSAPLNIRIYTLNGTLVHSTTSAAATSIPLPSLSTGLYVIQADCPDRRFTGSQIVRF